MSNYRPKAGDNLAVLAALWPAEKYWHSMLSSRGGIAGASQRNRRIWPKPSIWYMRM